jgi:Sulfotransferase domain
MSLVRQLRRKASRSRLRAPLVWFRHLGLKPEDVFVASYPRSGSTWLRFLLLELLTRDSAHFDTVNRTIPDVGHHRGCPAILQGGARLIKTHEAYRSVYRKAIYIVRDFRDVVISEFAYENARRRISEDFDSFLRLSLKSGANGYGTWQDHVTSWANSPPAICGDLLLIKFEDLRVHTEHTLEDVLEFLGLGGDRQQIRQAIANNNVQRMQEKEDEVSDIDGYSPRRASGNGNGSRFIRSGSTGAWRGKFSEQQVRLIEQYAGLSLARMGYPLEICPVAVD